MTLHRSIVNNIMRTAEKIGAMQNYDFRHVEAKVLTDLDYALTDVLDALNRARGVANLHKDYPAEMLTTLGQAESDPRWLDGLRLALVKSALLAYPDKPLMEAVDEFAFDLDIDDNTLDRILAAGKETP